MGKCGKKKVDRIRCTTLAERKVDSYFIGAAAAFFIMLFIFMAMLIGFLFVPTLERRFGKEGITPKLLILEHCNPYIVFLSNIISTDRENSKKPIEEETIS